MEYVITGLLLLSIALQLAGLRLARIRNDRRASFENFVASGVIQNRTPRNQRRIARKRAAKKARAL